MNLSNKFGLSQGELNYAANYLRLFGYAADVKSAQEMLGVQVDGDVGPETLRAMMHTPRCGCPDVAAIGGVANRWDFARATQSGLAYFQVGRVNNLDPTKQDELIIAAWESWERVCGIKIRRVRNQNDADILIDASNRRDEQFGSVGNVLAWAQLPQGASHTRQLIMKFDLAEVWDEGKFLGVAAHEFGHLLGLDHTQTAGELMFPQWQRNVSAPQRHYDIPQGKLRYGERTAPPPVVPPQGIKVEGRITINGKPYELRAV